MKHWPCGEAWVPRRRGLDLKRDYNIDSLRCTEHTYIVKAEYQREVTTWINHPPYREVCMPQRRGSNHKRYSLIDYSRCTTHASLDVAKPKGRISYMDKSDPKRDNPLFFEAYNTYLPQWSWTLRVKPLHGWTPCRKVWAPRKGGLDPRRDYLIASSRRTTHASFDEAEHHERSHYMNKPSTM